MVQMSFDTKNDSIAELEQAMHVLQDAIARRKRSPSAAAQPATSPEEETTIDTPFLSISFKDGDEPAKAGAEEPTLNQLIEDSSLTQEEMSKMFKQVEAADPPKLKPQKKESSEAAFIEIVEFDEEEEKKK